MSTHTDSAQRAKTVSPYGTWPSPITAELVASGSGGKTWPTGVGGETWWCASDPQTATVRLMRCATPGAPASPVLPTAAGWSVRNRALGYGGRPYTVVPGGERHVVVFTDHRDQRLYRAEIAALGGSASHDPEPTPLTPADITGVETCYADPMMGPGGEEVWCIREITRAATGPDDADPATRTCRELVAVPLSGAAADDAAAVRVVARSHHFITGARVSPDGAKLAWIGWNHPDMPWDRTELMVADLVEGRAADPVAVLGGPEVSVPQAEWADADTLYAMADPEGWWNLHEVTLDGASEPKVRCVLPVERECAGPVWKIGATWFAVTPLGVVLTHGVGDRRIALWDPTTGVLRDLAEGWTEFDPSVWASGRTAIVMAASATAGSTVLRVELPSPGEEAPDAGICTPHTDDHGVAAWGSVPQRRTAIDADGQVVHYVLYPPTNPEHEGAADEAPPLLIHVHGGPTNTTGAAPNQEFSYFTSRGFAVASVDYGGSTGYGRVYRDRLHHTWGIVDVQDSVTVARELAALGLADPERTAIRGGSAGGWTSLAALSSTDVFCCGAVYYPISDPLTWSGEQTHDFESRYLESLIGELPRDRARYEQVSPIGHADQIEVPIVMLQGSDDFICRPSQAQCIVDAVAERGIWHRYLEFAGEGHGFRLATSVVQSLRAEMELYGEAMGLAIQD